MCYDPIMNLTHKFWKQVKIGEPNECWPYLGPCNNKGYGQASFRRMGTRLAHRIAFWLVHGDFDISLMILHSCDNPPCCNPNHLRIGGPIENAFDIKIRSAAERLRALRAQQDAISQPKVYAMSRRSSFIIKRKVEHLLPVDLLQEVDYRLFDPKFNRRSYGALSTLIERLLSEWVQRTPLHPKFAEQQQKEAVNVAEQL